MLVLGLSGVGYSQCSLLPPVYTGSDKFPNRLCAPVTTDINYRIGFGTVATPVVLPVGPNYDVIFIWGDGTTDPPVPIVGGSTNYSVTRSHAYPANSDCEYLVTILFRVNGIPCTATLQEQFISTWRTDEYNGGDVKLISPVTGTTIHEVCEGDNISVIFEDQTDWNCNANHPANYPPNDPVQFPNEQYRWQQIVYNTPIAGAKIPNLFVDGIPVTGAGGVDILSNYQDTRGVHYLPPLVVVGDGDRRNALPITAAGGVGPGFPQVGDEFEVTIRYWNICNPYDNDIADGLPPSNRIDGDNPPVERTALIRIVDAPVQPLVDDQDICFNGLASMPPLAVTNVVGGLTYRWYETLTDAQNNTNIVQTGTSFTPSAAQAPVGVNDFFVTATTASNCISPIETVTLTRREDISTGPPPLVSPQLDICPNTTYVYSLPADPATEPVGGATEYIWSIVPPGTATIVSGQGTKEVTVSSSGSLGPFTLRVQRRFVNATGCASVFRSTVITVRANPNPSIMPSNLNICRGDTPTLNVNPNNPFGIISSHTWTGTDVNLVLDNTSIEEPTVLATAPVGSYTFTYTVTNSIGCSGSHDVNITINPEPTPVFAGPDQLLCNTLATPLAAAPPSFGSGSWSYVSGPDATPIFSNASSPTSTVTVNNPGVYQFQWTVTNSGCSRSSIVRIDFGAPPAQPTSSSPAFCSLSGTISGTAPTYENAQWSFVSGPGTLTFGNTSSPTTTVTASAYGTYQAKWEFTSGSCNPPRSVTITINFTPLPDAFDPQPELCEVIEGTSTATGVDLTGYNAGVTGVVPPGSRTVYWYASAFDQAGDINRITGPINVTNGGIFYTRVINIASPGSCAALGQVSFTVNPKPIAVDQNVLLCEQGPPGSNTVSDIDLTDPALKDQITAASPDRTVTWFTAAANAELNVSPITNPSAFDIVGTTAVYARVVNDLTGCYNVAEVNLVVNPLPLDQSIIGPAAPCVGTQVLYRVNPVSGAQYQWTIPPDFGRFGGGINDFYVLLEFTNNTPGTVRLKIVLNGCEGNEITKTITPAEIPHGYTIGGPAAACENSVVEYEVFSPNVATSTYNWQVISQATGLPGGGVIQSGQSTSKVQIQFEDENVAVYVTEINASGCPDDNPPHVDVAINRQPLIDNLITDVCSGSTSGITIAGNASSPVSVERIVVVADPFVSPGLVTTSVTPAGEYLPNGLENDQFENVTSISPLGVTYRVRPKSIDGCLGDERLVTLNVKAEPVVDASVIPKICSDQALGLTLSSPVGYLQADQFIIESVSYNNAVLTPHATNSSNIGVLVSPTEISNDKWTNLTNVQQTVVYQVRPYSSVTQCFGDPTANISVVILPNPTASLAAPVQVCEDEYFTLDFAFQNGQEPYVFDYTDGVTTFTLTGASQRPVPVPGITASTQYTLTKVTDYNGCVASTLPAPVMVDLINLNTTFTIDPATAQCSGGTFTFQWTAQPNVAYTWIWNDGTADEPVAPITGTLPVVRQIQHSFVSANVNSPTVFPVMLRAQSTVIGSCSKQSPAQSVTINPAIFMTASADHDKICSGEQVRITNSTAGGTQHVWFVRRQGVNEELQKRTLTSATSEVFTLTNTSANNPAPYEIVYQVSNGTCADELVFPVAVYLSPKAKFTVAAVTDFVGGNSLASFQNTSVPLTDTQFGYDWNFGAGAVPVLIDAMQPPLVRYTTIGQKFVKLSVDNEVAASNGLVCQHDTTLSIQILLPPLTADFKYTPQNLCFPADISVTENLATGDIFEWTLKNQNGQSLLISNDTLPTFRITSPGEYTIYLKTTNSLTNQTAFADNSAAPIKIFENPFASFEVVPDTVVFTPDDTGIEMRNQSLRASYFLWDFGDGETSEEVQPRHFYQEDGSYTITMVAFQDNGRLDQNGDGVVEPTNLVCRDTTTQVIVAKPGGRVKVPNAFTPDESGPNGGYDDGQFNDVFRPVMEGVEEFQMEIFDRWGNLIFQSIDKNQGWDGYDKHGRLMPAGVYVYKLTMRLSDSQRTTQLGDVTLIR